NHRRGIRTTARATRLPMSSHRDRDPLPTRANRIMRSASSRPWLILSLRHPSNRPSQYSTLHQHRLISTIGRSHTHSLPSHEDRLSGTLDDGCAQLVSLPPAVELGNKGGLLTVFDNNALKVDGVSYTQDQAKKEGWPIVF